MDKNELHRKIMNIQISHEKMDKALGDAVLKNSPNVSKMIEMAYRLGHRDCRHDAAELSLSED